MIKYLIYHFDNGQLKRYIKKEYDSPEECIELLKTKFKKNSNLMWNDQYIICTHLGSYEIKIYQLIERDNLQD